MSLSSRLLKSSRKGNIGLRSPVSSKGGFLDILMVTVLKQIESKGKVEGEIGVLSENIERAVRREGSWNAGASGGLEEVVIGKGTELPGGDKGGVDDKEGPEEDCGREG